MLENRNNISDFVEYNTRERLKTVVHADPPVNVRDLKKKIRVTRSNLREYQIMNAVHIKRIF